MTKLSLGPLEQEIMKCVWAQQSCTVRDVVGCLNQNRDIAYNTVQTVMTRLTDKNILERSLQGKTHFYTPKKEKKKALQQAISQLMSGFRNQFGEEALVAFIDGLDDISPETRQKLIEKLAQK